MAHTKLRIVLEDYPLHSGNRTTYGHWKVAYRIRREAGKKIWLACYVQHKTVPVFKGKVTLQFTRQMPKGCRPFDTANIFQAFKGIQDMLCVQRFTKLGKPMGGLLGIIEDDRPQLCDMLMPIQERSPDGKPRVFIDIEGDRVDVMPGRKPLDNGAARPPTGGGDPALGLGGQAVQAQGVHNQSRGRRNVGKKAVPEPEGGRPGL